MELEQQEAALKKIANDSALRKNVLAIIENAATNPDNDRNAELTHSLRLAGKLDISQAQPLLARLINECSTKLNANELKNAIIALSQLSGHEQESATILINHAEQLVNVEDRIQLNKSKQPVLEESASQTKTYWQILRALGNLVTDNAMTFLVKTLDDYAPDMRSCALESIIEIYKKDSKINLPKPIDQILQTALKDPSPMMQLTALLGVNKLNRASLINDIIPLINAQENTVSKQALSTLAHLAQSGHQIDVKSLLEEKIKTIKEVHKKKRILDILQKY